MTASSRSNTFPSSAEKEEEVAQTATSHLKAPAGTIESVRGGPFFTWAGWTGLLGTTAFLVTVAMTFVSIPGPTGTADMTRFLDEVSAGGSLQLVYGIAGIALTILYIPLAFGAYRMQQKTTTSWYGALAIVMGLAILFPAYVINLHAPTALVAMSAAGIGAETLLAHYEVARTLAEIFFSVGSILSLGFGPLLLGYGWLRRSRRFLGWTGVLTGVTGMVWFVWLVESGAVGIVLIVNVLASLVFFTGVSVALVSEGKTSG